MTVWLAAWLAVFAVGGGLELVAVFNHTSGDTLSEQVWRLLALDKPETGPVALRRIAFAGLWFVLTMHFLLKWV